jgi:hypothetical protein
MDAEPKRYAFWFGQMAAPGMALFLLLSAKGG